ncbi:MAG: SpoIIE family protein phosphatase, partial [Cyclobacteriaceae bacterium]
MEFIRDRHNWSLILAGFFILCVGVFAFYLYAVSQTDLLHHNSAHIPAVLFTGLAFIFLSGSLAIWLAFYNRKALLTTGPEKNNSPSLNERARAKEADVPTSALNAVTEDTPAETNIDGLHLHNLTGLDEDVILESVLMVSNDVAERKRIALEIQLQNKKVTESINYAKRIQSAILPNMKLINRALPDSFILYKPRDIVSGDFPWFVQMKNEIFMAAVDCTGHGVPGALLSLVGYFLLNDIVRSRRVTDPGKILDLLDEGVSTTLRPAEDAGTKDGMDISLCKINIENRELEYAGAHRPLYMIRDGVLEEIKGNKFPIGGGIFKNQTNFTNYRIKLNKGDSIYYCSDGYCDQFGGPDGKKFGTKQLRQIIGKVHTLSMKEAHQVFEEQWERWKGNQK